MDCPSCYYPNEEDARFCIRCAAALGVSLQQLPSEPPPAPDPRMGAAVPPDAGRVDPGFLGERYRVLRCLGSGGFGSVYEAEETDTGLRVAVKILHHSALLDARMRERFLQEARMIAELRSPHVVRLYDFAVTPIVEVASSATSEPTRPRSAAPRALSGGLPYLVMELIEGKNLASLLMRGVLSPRRTLHILAQVCAALGEAHALGIVHRDIKPDNILLVKQPSSRAEDLVKVVDFGVARLRGPATRPSDVLGTPAFISPETLANEPVDGRSDLYSLGMLMWQMMLGDLPFPASNQAVMMNSHLAAPRRRPSDILPQLRGRLPAALEALMVCLIARRPVDRPASAYEVRAELLALLPRVPDEPFADMALPNFGPCWDGPLDPLPSSSAQAVAYPASPSAAAAGQAELHPTKKAPRRMQIERRRALRTDQAPPHSAALVEPAVPLYSRLQRLVQGWGGRRDRGDASH
ncbi:MAG: protein kinase [Myxococcales bacterium]|nr:protein kinase [Myxococcales bacterium]